MDKPISLKLREFKNNAVSLINNSGLPLFVIEPILKDILGAVQTKVELEYQEDVVRYNQSLTEKGEKQDD